VVPRGPSASRSPHRAGGVEKDVLLSGLSSEPDGRLRLQARVKLASSEGPTPRLREPLWYGWPRQSLKEDVELNELALRARLAVLSAGELDARSMRDKPRDPEDTPFQEMTPALLAKLNKLLDEEPQQDSTS
jgi:hypothetical protein